MSHSARPKNSPPNENGATWKICLVAAVFTRQSGKRLTTDYTTGFFCQPHSWPGWNGGFASVGSRGGHGHRLHGCGIAGGRDEVQPILIDDGEWWKILPVAGPGLPLRDGVLGAGVVNHRFSPVGFFARHAGHATGKDFRTWWLSWSGSAAWQPGARGVGKWAESGSF